MDQATTQGAFVFCDPCAIRVEIRRAKKSASLTPLQRHLRVYLAFHTHEPSALRA